MPPRKIMLIRHGEKPEAGAAALGVDADGNQDPHSLIVRGWQRAGALVRFFGSPQNPLILRPTYLYSPPPEGSDEGGRPFETIDPLSAMGITHDTSVSVGNESGLVSDMMT